MNLDYIGKKLNEIFEGYDEDFRQIVFWYDDKAEFGDEINNLKLENAQIYHLKEDNWLFTKYFMEIEDQNTNYLIYAPFSMMKIIFWLTWHITPHNFTQTKYRSFLRN